MDGVEREGEREGEREFSGECEVKANRQLWRARVLHEQSWQKGKECAVRTWRGSTS